MANIRISELNELEEVDNDDLLVIVDTSSNETKKVKARNVGTGGGGSDVVIIDDEQPTSEFNKLWIDTGEVGSQASEITNEYSESTGIGYSANYINNLHTYTTTEQRVGTWIDGKPLYRKVVTASASASSTFNIIDSSVNTIVKTTTYLTNDSGQVLPIPYYIDGNTYGYGNNYQNNYIYTGKGTVFTTGTLIVIIEYTKTTD